MTGGAVFNVAGVQALALVMSYGFYVVPSEARGCSRACLCFFDVCPVVVGCWERMFSSPSFSRGIGDSQGDAKEKVRGEEVARCLPVTIRQIQRAVSNSAKSGGDVMFFDLEVGMLLVVGCVEGVERQGLNLELRLNDGTDRITVKYIAMSDSEEIFVSIEPGRYVAVYGEVRTAPRVHFAAIGLRLVETADEISYHGIEVAYVALRHKPPKAAEAPTPGPKVGLQPIEFSPQKPEAMGPISEGYSELKG